MSEHSSTQLGEVPSLGDEDGYQMSRNEEDDTWDEDESTVSFSKSDLEMVYGKSRAPKIGSEPGLLQASVNMKTFGKAERITSRYQQSILSRLKSIHLDATTFVKRVCDSLPDYAKFANLRNGLWYLGGPDRSECRFRSTDGHALSWSFYISRANLNVANASIKQNGAIIVDSTRSGKTFPDSFNRTVPLWCAVMNRARGLSCAQIELPKWLPPQEATRIKAEQLDAWSDEVKELIKNSNEEIAISTLPFKPFWIANDKLAWRRETGGLDVLLSEIANFEGECIPIICVSASAVIDAAVHRESFNWHYIPGAADDEENWSCGLTAKIFWDDHDFLLASTNETECDSRVMELVQRIGNVIEGQRVDKNSAVIANAIIIRWSSTPGSSTTSNPRNNYDGTWIQGSDKSWNRRNPVAWQKRAIPGVLQAFKSCVTSRNVSELFEITATDVETACTLALAILAAYFDAAKLNVLGDGNTNKNIEKPLLKKFEGAIVSSIASESVAIPRRLHKEVHEFFAYRNWEARLVSADAIQ